MPKTKALPPRDLATVLEAFPWHRQSLLSDADTCMLATRWRLETLEAFPHLRSTPQTSPWNTAEQARGILAHRFAAEYLSTLWAAGHDRMPVAETLEILYEVCAQRDTADADVVYLPARERRQLRMFAVCLTYDTKRRELRRWDMSRLLAIEERQWAKVAYTAPSGATIERVITGAPDVTLRDSRRSDGLVVLDWKTTPKAPPKAPDRKRDANGHVRGDDAPSNVSYEGYFQQRVYGLLELANRQGYGCVTLRECYPLDPNGLQVREATVYAEDLEKIARELGVVSELLDRAIAGGSRSELWKPTPGRHCSHCPRPRSCPIPEPERDEGSITSLEEAKRRAADFVVADSIRSQARRDLKAYHEETGHPIPVENAKGRYEFRFAEGSKAFDLYVPSDSDRGPEDVNLAATFKAAAERKRSA